jgi:ATPase subunit of ABC transporter with duplicated ATPase domains
MSEQIILTLRRLVKRYPPDRTVLDGITLAFLHGAKIGVLGANGSGKSSLLRIMAGIDTHVGGDVLLAPGATVGMLEQEPQLDETRTVYENVEDGMRGTRDLLDRFNAISARLGEPLDADEMESTLAEMGEVQERIDAIDGWNLERTLATAMDALRVPPGEAEVGTLSGGERRRVALCRLLLQAPDLLLLDEPTNHLDAESVAWLERFLADYRGTVVAVTHDRYFLDNVAGWILELDRGKGIPYQGNYSGWLEQKQARLALEEKGESARRRALAREMEWAGMSQKARQAKGKARLQRYESLLADEANATKRPVLLIDGLRLCAPPGTGGVPLSIETRSVFGWMANSTEPVAIWPVLSVTVNATVEFPSTVGMPLTTPVLASRDKPVGKTNFRMPQNETPGGIRRCS